MILSKSSIIIYYKGKVCYSTHNIIITQRFIAFFHRCVTACIDTSTTKLRQHLNNIIQVHVYCKDTSMVDQSRILLGGGAIVGDTVILDMVKESLMPVVPLAVTLADTLVE